MRNCCVRGCVETTRRYAHLSDVPFREASERTEATISAALDGKPAAEVVPLRRALVNPVPPLSVGTARSRASSATRSPS